MNLSVMGVVAALAVDGVVNLPLVANLWTVPGMNAVVARPAVGNAAADDVAAQVVVDVTHQEAAGCVTGGE